MASSLRATCKTQLVAARHSQCAASAFPGSKPVRGSSFLVRKITAPQRHSARVSAVLTKEKVSLDVQKMEPMGDRVLVKPVEEKAATSGGVLLPSSATKGQQDALIGEVLAIGDEVDIGVKVGDTVVYQKYSTADVETASGEICFVAQKSILAVVS